MVIAGVLVNEEDIPKLKSMGAKDSKLLTRKQRDDLFEPIKQMVKAYKIIVIPAEEIDRALFSDDLNLNWLEAHKSAEIITELKPERAVIDSPSNNCKAYTLYVEKLLAKTHCNNSLFNHDHHKIEVICTHKADVKFPEVSAASILAKVTRDREMDEICKKYGDAGPGYMSNPITQKFLKENWDKHPEIFRHSWMSYKNHEEQRFQQTFTDFANVVEKQEGMVTKEDLKALEAYGYQFTEAKGEHEVARLKGPCTITLYTTGKLLIQGKPDKKEEVEKVLRKAGWVG